MTDRVLMFFKDICALPHGSGNCSLVGDYLVDFAKNRGLYYFRDKKGNVVGVFDNNIVNYLINSEHIFILKDTPYIYDDGVYVMTHKSLQQI